MMVSVSHDKRIKGVLYFLLPATLAIAIANTVRHIDCVSFKPNATNIIVQNIHCNGSHGISVGSLGQYPGSSVHPLSCC